MEESLFQEARTKKELRSPSEAVFEQGRLTRGASYSVPSGSLKGPRGFAEMQKFKAALRSSQGFNGGENGESGENGGSGGNMSSSDDSGIGPMWRPKLSKFSNVAVLDLDELQALAEAADFALGSASDRRTALDSGVGELEGAAIGKGGTVRIGYELLVLEAEPFARGGAVEPRHQHNPIVTSTSGCCQSLFA